MCESLCYGAADRSAADRSAGDRSAGAELPRHSASRFTPKTLLQTPKTLLQSPVEASAAGKRRQMSQLHAHACAHNCRRKGEEICAALIFILAFLQQWMRDASKTQLPAAAVTTYLLEFLTRTFTNHPNMINQCKFILENDSKRASLSKTCTTQGPLSLPPSLSRFAKKVSLMGASRSGLDL